MTRPRSPARRGTSYYLSQKAIEAIDQLSIILDAPRGKVLEALALQALDAHREGRLEGLRLSVIPRAERKV